MKTLEINTWYNFKVFLSYPYVETVDGYLIYQQRDCGYFLVPKIFNLRCASFNEVIIEIKKSIKNQFLLFDIMFYELDRRSLKQISSPYDL